MEDGGEEEGVGWCFVGAGFVWDKRGGEREGEASWLASTHPLFHLNPHPIISKSGGDAMALFCVLPLLFVRKWISRRRGGVRVW